MKNIITSLGLSLIISTLMSQGHAAGGQMKSDYVEIKRQAFQKVVDGKPVDLYTLKNSSGMVVKITNQGAKIVQLLVPDRKNQMGDVVLGYETIDQYVASPNKPNFPTTVLNPGQWFTSTAMFRFSPKFSAGQD